MQRIVYIYHNIFVGPNEPSIARSIEKVLRVKSIKCKLESACKRVEKDVNWRYKNQNSAIFVKK